ncbi:hypothetical protein [Rhizobium laguerreae]|uniref:Uncharacterized protein n=1 Tax=Rhizobium laguerreae TaxID=1076926 RepID=A0AAX2QAZ1_9HYPH|nr:hypothetical protein [Rhizobium laguerreae]TCU14198.1 hypothetical protein EV131_12315 [Rhizobium laguerreae]
METAGNGTVVMVTGAAGNLGRAVVHGLVANRDAPAVRLDTPAGEGGQP